jgi:hypothetical protein
MGRRSLVESVLHDWGDGKHELMSFMECLDTSP